jgi:hypothetical protein
MTIALLAHHGLSLDLLVRGLWAQALRRNNWMVSGLYYCGNCYNLSQTLAGFGRREEIE